MGGLCHYTVQMKRRINSPSEYTPLQIPGIPPDYLARPTIQTRGTSSMIIRNERYAKCLLGLAQLYREGPTDCWGRRFRKIQGLNHDL